MSSSIKYLFVLTLCIASRLATSIYYIEDIDSLRFALAANDFDVTKQQPHFPGYPLYCYMLNLFQYFIGNIGICFSIIGGCSIFLIYLFISKISSFFIKTKNEWMLFFLLFTHPFLWIMSNRYMPDIMGLAILIIATYFFLKTIQNPKFNSIFILGLLIGFECGIRLSYLPFFIPLIYYTLTKKNYALKIIPGLIIGVFIWLIPFIISNDWNELIELGLRNTKGHFYEWGGTVQSNTDSYLIRVAGFFRSVWVDVMCCWFPGRSYFTLITSGIWTVIIFFILRKIKIIQNIPPQIFTIIYCLLFYSLWIFFFQNIVYKPRHILPLIPFILLALFLVTQKNTKTLYSISLLTFILFFNSIVCLKLVKDHTHPSAISQSKDWIQKNHSENWVICSDNLKNFYFKKHKKINHLRFISIENEAELINSLNEGKIICSDMELKGVLGIDSFEKNIFYHNPNVNRLWSKIVIKKYKL